MLIDIFPVNWSYSNPITWKILLINIFVWSVLYEMLKKFVRKFKNVYNLHNLPTTIYYLDGNVVKFLMWSNGWLNSKWLASGKLFWDTNIHIEQIFFSDQWID